MIESMFEKIRQDEAGSSLYWTIENPSNALLRSYPFTTILHKYQINNL